MGDDAGTGPGLADADAVSGEADGVSLGIDPVGVGGGSVVADGSGEGEFGPVSGDGIAVGVVVVVGGAGRGAVVVGAPGEADGAGAVVGASAATCAAAGGATGGAAGGWASSGTVDRPPLPFVPGGTGPGAAGMGMTPVRYARAHCSTTST